MGSLRAEPKTRDRVLVVDDDPKTAGRVRSVLRRARPAQPAELVQRGDLLLDLGGHRAALGGRSVELSPAEFEILAALLNAGGRVVTRDRLINRLHPHGEGIDNRSIDVYVGRLRAKLGDSSARPPFVVTVRRVGYLLGGRFDPRVV